MNFTLDELEQAACVVYTAMLPTPQYAWPLLSKRLGTELWVKHENAAPTGAFKVRGGLVYVERLLRERPDVRAITSATRGNHGQSLAFAGARAGLDVSIFVPHGNSREKNAAMRAFGARLYEHGADFDEARLECVRRAESEGRVYVPSYHPDLVLGVATYALEFLRAAPPLDVLYVPIGMGSGICACLAVRDLLGLKTAIVGVQSSAAPSYFESLRQGRLINLDSATTHADGMATRMPDAQALETIRDGVERIVLVDDDEVAAAIRAYWSDTHQLAEGAGAAGLAAALKDRDQLTGKRVGVVMTGGNIDLALFREWVLEPRMLV
jgi:threonine dehydratase